LKHAYYSELLRNAIASTGVGKWEAHDYRFLFSDQMYYWKEREIKITPAEALHLYERLILLVPLSSAVSTGAMHQMRKRHGNSFLGEVWPYRPSHNPGGRPSDFVYEVDGKYIREDGRQRFQY
jgi:hypothetical protein